MLNIQTVFLKRLLPALLILFCSAAKADVGLSYLGMCHKNWPCEKSIRYLGDSLVTGWLENTFDADCSCGERLLKDPRPKKVRIHIANSVCMRNGRCGPYEIFAGETVNSANKKILNNDPKLLGKFEAVLNNAAKRFRNAPNLTCQVSPCLECDLSGPARRKLLNITAGAFPQCELVDNPYGDKCLNGFICEKHGVTANPGGDCITDMDGADFFVTDGWKYVNQSKNCRTQYFWTLGFNLINPKIPFVDPRKRTYTPSDAQFKVLSDARKCEFSKAYKVDMRNCKTKNPIRDGERKDFLFKLSDGKPHAVVLFPRQYKTTFDNVGIFQQKKLVDKLKYRYKYSEDGSYRQVWDSNKLPSDIPAGSVLKADGNCWVLKYPAFRMD